MHNNNNSSSIHNWRPRKSAHFSSINKLLFMHKIFTVYSLPTNNIFKLNFKSIYKNKETKQRNLKRESNVCIPVQGNKQCI